MKKFLCFILGIVFSVAVAFIGLQQGIAALTVGWRKFLKADLSTTVTTVKSAQGHLGGYYIYNPNASVCYIQIFDVSGSVTLGTTTPDLSFGIPASSGANLNISANNEYPAGIAFSNAIKIAAATTATGNSACGSALVVNIWYD